MCISSPHWKFSLLTNVREMEPVMMAPADGRQRVLVQEGTVALGSNLILKFVFMLKN